MKVKQYINSYFIWYLNIFKLGRNSGLRNTPYGDSHMVISSYGFFYEFRRRLGSSPLIIDKDVPTQVVTILAGWGLGIGFGFASGQWANCHENIFRLSSSDNPNYITYILYIF